MTTARIVFCDFDGTITEEETLQAMFREFAPEANAEFLPAIYEQRIPVAEGVKRIVGSIPSARYAEILAFTREKALRPGLEDLLDFLDARSADFIVLSGGLLGMVESSLGPLLERVRAVHAGRVDDSGEYLRVWSPDEENGELVAKARVMAAYGPAETVVIGDGITDLSMAGAADHVLARDLLARYLDEQGKTYHPFSDFHDVRRVLAGLWGSPG